MKILFLTIGRFNSINDKGLYPDLLRALKNDGNEVYIVSPVQKREKKKTELIDENSSKLLKVKIGNITKCSIIEKGISTLMIKKHYKKAIKKYFNDISFDMIIYTTPPITLVGVVKYLKKKFKYKTYLLLKDIFPQNAIDIDILKKGLIYYYFRLKEKELYKISDRIGCMSQANVDYVLKHNSEINKDKVEICPNSIEVIDKSVKSNEKKYIREKYNIPLNKKVFIYGGNLGKPQGVSFIIECLKSQIKNKEIFFVIIGNGTEYSALEKYLLEEKQENVMLMSTLPKEEYDQIVAACDVGLIFLDYRFTIPNFPSRTLGYMQAKLPILACTDKNTDVGDIIEDNNCGWKCYSDDIKGFCEKVELIGNSEKKDLLKIGKNGFQYLKNNYSVEKCSKIITNAVSLLKK